MLIKYIKGEVNMLAERKVDLNKPLAELAAEGWSFKELLEVAGFHVTGEEKRKKEELTQEITKILHEIGIPAHIKGYDYLRYAIAETVRDKKVIKPIMKVLYSKTAKEFGVTASGVERNMRLAIEQAWNRGNPEIMHKYFGYTVSYSKGKNTNGEFIAMIVDKLRQEGYGPDQ